MNQIPVSFLHEGKTFKGHFTELRSGAAQDCSTWHLMSGGYYCGQLRLIKRSRPVLRLAMQGKELEEMEWMFDPTPKTEGFVELTDFFADIIISWYQ